MILHFWASWCAPCLTEVADWVALAKRYESEPIQWIAVSLDQNWSDAERILPSSQLSRNILSLIDLFGKIPDQYGTYQYPETYLINPKLEIVTKWVGAQQWDTPQSQELIRQFLKVSNLEASKGL